MAFVIGELVVAGAFTAGVVAGAFTAGVVAGAFTAGEAAGEAFAAGEGLIAGEVAGEALATAVAVIGVEIPATSCHSPLRRAKVLAADILRLAVRGLIPGVLKLSLAGNKSSVGIEHLHLEISQLDGIRS